MAILSDGKKKPVSLWAQMNMASFLESWLLIVLWCRGTQCEAG